jgi:ABC-type amino acid transport substrate-binding protein
MTTTLKIGVLEDNLPFSTCKPDFNGITVDIWKKTAEINKITNYEFKCLPRVYQDAVDAVERGEYDVVLGNFSITTKRLNQVLFSRAFYISKMKIYRKRQQNFVQQFFYNKPLQYIFLSLIVLLSIFSLIYCLYTKESFLSSFYYTYLTFFSNVREFVEIKNPPKYINYLYAITRYLFFTLILTQLINIVINYKTHITDEEFKQMKDVHTIKGSSYVDFMKEIGKNPIEHETDAEIIDLMGKSKDHVYIFDDINIIEKSIKDSKYDFLLDSTKNEVVSDIFTIIVNKNNSDLLTKITGTIISLKETGIMGQICKGYLSTEDALNCL